MLGVYIFISLLLISLIRDIRDEKTRECMSANKKILPITLIHHFFSIFVLFGWLLSPISLVKIYAIVTLSTIVYWGVFGFCHVSKYVNKTCGWDKDKYFNDIVSELKSSSKESIFYLLGLTVAFLRIYYFKK
jgi:hypothetical protein